MEPYSRSAVELGGVVVFFFPRWRLISAVTLITIYPNDQVFEGFWHRGGEKSTGRK